MIRRLMSAAILALLSGCSSQGSGAFGVLADLAADRVLGAEEGAPPPEVTRAQLDEIPFATIALTFESAPRAFVVPLANNGGYLTYQDPNRRGIVLFGGAVAGTDGLAQDLLGVRHSLDDPVARQRPLAEWPGQYDREYQYRLRDLTDFSVVVTCLVEPVAPEVIEIVERQYETVRVLETCHSPRRSFVNTYSVEPATGFIWRSEQWLGPNLNPVIIEIIRPFTPT